ncbi:MAG: hypothetical protein FJ308_20650 [Planctomycetes bacterium]|nr:hypothetical protein [Planctomycetota bacterium]
MVNEASESMIAGRGVERVAGRAAGVSAAGGFVAGVGESRLDRVSRLSREIRTLETAGRPGGVRISSGSVGMDGCLPGGGYAKGSMLELVHGGMSHRRGMFCGMGLMGLGVRIAKEWISDGRYLVILDRDRQFYAPGVAAMGVPLERLIVLQPSSESDAIWGMDQALRNGAAGAVVAWVHRLEDRVARRLQLATEHGGGLGVLLRDFHSSRTSPSWADVQWRVRGSDRTADDHASRRVLDWQKRWYDMELTRAIGGRVGSRVRLGIDASGEWIEESRESGASHEQKSSLHLAAQLAQPARSRREMAS